MAITAANTWFTVASIGSKYSLQAKYTVASATDGNTRHRNITTTLRFCRIGNDTFYSSNPDTFKLGKSSSAYKSKTQAIDFYSNKSVKSYTISSLSYTYKNVSYDSSGNAKITVWAAYVRGVTKGSPKPSNFSGSKTINVANIGAVSSTSSSSTTTSTDPVWSASINGNPFSSYSTSNTVGYTINTSGQVVANSNATITLKQTNSSYKNSNGNAKWSVKVWYYVGNNKGLLKSTLGENTGAQTLTVSIPTSLIYLILNKLNKNLEEDEKKVTIQCMMYANDIAWTPATGTEVHLGGNEDNDVLTSDYTVPFINTYQLYKKSISSSTQIMHLKASVFCPSAYSSATGTKTMNVEINPIGTTTSLTSTLTSSSLGTYDYIYSVTDIDSSEDTSTSKTISYKTIDFDGDITFTYATDTMANVKLSLADSNITIETVGNINKLNNQNIYIAPLTADTSKYKPSIDGSTIITSNIDRSICASSLYEYKEGTDIGVNTSFQKGGRLGAEQLIEYRIGSSETTAGYNYEDAQGWETDGSFFMKDNTIYYGQFIEGEI